MEHGHALVIRALKERRPDWLGRTDIRMLEVGTTREPLPSQDSTRVLSRFCQEHGLIHLPGFGGQALSFPLDMRGDGAPSGAS